MNQLISNANELVDYIGNLSYVEFFNDKLSALPSITLKISEGKKTIQTFNFEKTKYIYTNNSLGPTHTYILYCTDLKCYIRVKYYNTSQVRLNCKQVYPHQIISLVYLDDEEIKNDNNTIFTK